MTEAEVRAVAVVLARMRARYSSGEIDPRKQYADLEELLTAMGRPYHPKDPDPAVTPLAERTGDEVI